jgi:hypothetical protein
MTASLFKNFNSVASLAVDLGVLSLDLGVLSLGSRLEYRKFSLTSARADFFALLDTSYIAHPSHHPPIPQTHSLKPPFNPSVCPVMTVERMAAATKMRIKVR